MAELLQYLYFCRIWRDVDTSRDGRSCGLNQGVRNPVNDAGHVHRSEYQCTCGLLVKVSGYSPGNNTHAISNLLLN